MTLISFKEKSTPCSCCQNLRVEGDYAFGADFPAVENNDSFYIRKSIRATALSLFLKVKALTIHAGFLFARLAEEN